VSLRLGLRSCFKIDDGTRGGRGSHNLFVSIKIGPPSEAKVWLTPGKSKQACQEPEQVPPFAVGPGSVDPR
jgi:hypothetical protein